MAAGGNPKPKAQPGRASAHLAARCQEILARSKGQAASSCLQGPHPVRSMHSPTHQDEYCVLAAAVGHSPHHHG